MTKVSAVVCVDRNMGIGYENELLYRNSTDMAFFNGFTQGKTLIGGRRTLEGIKSLPNRQLICISSDPQKTYDEGRGKFIMAGDLENSKHLVGVCEGREVVVIGGEAVYKELASMVTDLYLTQLNIPLTELKEADTHFPIDDYMHLTESEVIFKNDEMTIYHCYGGI